MKFAKYNVELLNHFCEFIRSRQQDLFNLMGAMYASVLFVGINNCSGVQPVVAVERMVFYRERAAGMYSTFPYSFAQVLEILIP